MKYGYARVSTNGQSVDAQVNALKAAGAKTVFQETASGAKTERAQLRRVIGQLAKGDVLMVTRLDRLARSTRDLLNTLDAIAKAGAGFRSLADAWADTTTAHGRLMLTVLRGLAAVERELVRVRTHGGRERAKVKGVDSAASRSSASINARRRSAGPRMARSHWPRSAAATK